MAELLPTIKSLFLVAFKVTVTSMLFLNIFVTGNDLMLDPLADISGLTLTHLPQIIGPVIHGSDDLLCTSINQYGSIRS